MATAEESLRSDWTYRARRLIRECCKLDYLAANRMHKAVAEALEEYRGIGEAVLACGSKEDVLQHITMCAAMKGDLHALGTIHDIVQAEAIAQRPWMADECASSADWERSVRAYYAKRDAKAEGTDAVAPFGGNDPNAQAEEASASEEGSGGVVREDLLGWADRLSPLQRRCDELYDRTRGGIKHVMRWAHDRNKDTLALADAFAAAASIEPIVILDNRDPDYPELMLGPEDFCVAALVRARTECNVRLLMRLYNLVATAVVHATPKFASSFPLEKMKMPKSST